MRPVSRVTVLASLLTTIAGAASLGAEVRREPSCPFYACPSGWENQCGQNNSAQAMCAAAGCTGDLNYAYCSLFAPCDGDRVGAVCVEA